MHPSPDLDFRKSSYSDRSDCVEVADLPGSSVVRDTQDRQLGHLEFSGTEWIALLRTARS